MDMYTTILIFIAIGLVGLAIGIFLIISSGRKKVDPNKKNDKNDKNKTDSENSTYIYKKNNDSNVIKKDIFDFMEFDKIVDDMIVQEKNGKYIMVLQCKGINYDLMSEVEQLAVEEGFITFLNTLKFPVQLYVQARAINLDKSLDIYKKNINVLSVKYNEAADKYDRAARRVGIDASELDNATMEKEKFANMLDYAKDITRYVEKMSLNKHMLQRKFYIVYSYNKSEVNASTNFNEHEIQDICRRELYTRGQTLISALASCSVNAKVLDSNELAELLYVSYNRDDEKLMDIKTALDSGFYRLYTTSKDVKEKKDELMLKEIKEEAMRRVKSAINETLNVDEVKTKEELIEDYEENADREAINIIRNSNLSADIKERLSNDIAQKHVLGVEARKRAKEEIDTELKKEEEQKNENNENSEKNNDNQNNDNKSNENISSQEQKDNEKIEKVDEEINEVKDENNEKKENANNVSESDQPII